MIAEPLGKYSLEPKEWFASMGISAARESGTEDGI